VVDEFRVRRLLRQATDTVEVLDEEADADDAVRAQCRWLDSIKYNVIAAIECCVDVGQRICAVNGWGPPASNADTFTILAAHGVLEDGTASDMARASGFRNVLVYEYIEIRDDLVVASLDRTGDIRRFAAQIAVWLACPCVQTWSSWNRFDERPGHARCPPGALPVRRGNRNTDPPRGPACKASGRPTDRGKVDARWNSP
jgi:uncharacterized protein YutE (UPF0331/DUF86 family)